MVKPRFARKISVKAVVFWSHLCDYQDNAYNDKNQADKGATHHLTTAISLKQQVLALRFVAHITRTSVRRNQPVANADSFTAVGAIYDGREFTHGALCPMLLHIILLKERHLMLVLNVRHSFFCSSCSIFI